MFSFFLFALILGGAMLMLGGAANGGTQLPQASFDDALADARRFVNRLGYQIVAISGEDRASTQAMADAAEHYNAASTALAEATTVRQAQLARESALEGLYYVAAARELVGLPPGPPLPELEAQRQAGRVTERRTVEHEGETFAASPYASEDTPHYYPGGAVAGRPVPAGWYSAAWWAPAAMTGMWAAGSMMFYSAMFSGMAGAASAEHFAAGVGDAGGSFADGFDGGPADGFDGGLDSGLDGSAEGAFDGFGDLGGLDFDLF